MKKANVFKTEDGRLFEDEGEGLRHEFMLKVRGLIQTNAMQKRHDEISITEVSSIIRKNAEELRDIITASLRKIKGYESRTSISMDPEPTARQFSFGPAKK